MYQSGLHILLSLSSPKKILLQDMNAWHIFIVDFLLKNNLEIVGETSHHFDTEGFTMAICLKESHLCIHTWPEFNRLTMDIYLCNYQKDNSSLVKTIANENILYFSAEIIQQNEIYR
jgi:S-adenosylmethionine decarboxylase